MIKRCDGNPASAQMEVRHRHQQNVIVIPGERRLQRAAEKRILERLVLRHDALRQPGRAGGVGQQRDIVTADFDRRIGGHIFLDPGCETAVRPGRRPKYDHLEFRFGSLLHLFDRVGDLGTGEHDRRPCIVENGDQLRHRETPVEGRECAADLRRCEPHFEHLNRVLADVTDRIAVPGAHFQQAIGDRAGTVLQLRIGARRRTFDQRHLPRTFLRPITRDVRQISYLCISPHFSSLPF